MEEGGGAQEQDKQQEGGEGTAGKPGLFSCLGYYLRPPSTWHRLCQPELANTDAFTSFLDHASSLPGPRGASLHQRSGMVSAGSTEDTSTAGNNTGDKKSRSRNGCLACRRTRVSDPAPALARSALPLTHKVKCDETHPTCGRCLDRKQGCEWPTDPGAPAVTAPARKQRNPRPVSSCDSCRVKKASLWGVSVVHVV